MRVPFWYYQYLDKEQLAHNLGQSLLYLHGQPPLLNLLVGLALKLANVFGASPQAIAYVLQIVLGGISVCGFAGLAGLLIDRTAPRRCCIALLTCHPVFYMTLHEFFYTFHEIAALALAPIFIARYLRSGGVGALAAVCLLLGGLSLERTLFHPVLVFLVPVALVGLRGRLAGSKKFQRTGIAVCLALTAGGLLAWPMKNYVIFGAFTSSTWQGYNFSRGLALGLTPFDDIVLATPPEPFASIPVLSKVFKTPEEPGGPVARNWNHYGLIEVFREDQRVALEAIRNDPARLLRKAWTNYRLMSRFSGRHPKMSYMGTMDRPAPPASEVWMRLYEAITVQEFRLPDALIHPDYRKPADPDSIIPPYLEFSGFFLTFPLVLVLAARKSWRIHRDDPVLAAVTAFMIATVLWVTAMILFVDGDEGNRIRTSTEMYLVVLAFWIFPAKSRTRKEGHDLQD